MSLVSVYCLFPDADEADAVARQMIERRLAACANLWPACRSLYRWDGAMAEAAETPVLFKTSDEQAEPLMAALAQAHSYDVPCIVQWPVERCLATYADWVGEATRRGPRHDPID